MVRLPRLSLGVLLLLTLGVAPTRADVTYSDTTFNLADYSASPTYSSDPSASIAYGSASNTLTFTATFTQATATTYVTAQGLANTTFTYDPTTQGAISSIDASVLKDLSSDADAPSGTFGNTFRPTIFQDGVFYLATIPGPGSSSAPFDTGFVLLAQNGLQASDFSSYDFATGAFGASHPDFAGDPLLLGLSQISSLGAYTGHVIAKYQDLSFDIHSVPEPSSLVLGGLGLFGALTVKVGRRRPGSQG